MTNTARRESPLRHAAVPVVIVLALGATARAAGPATAQVDWSARIDAALRDTGQVGAVAAALADALPDAPGVWAARVRVAQESGDLPGALDLIESATRMRPDDPSLLAALADLQQQLGRDNAAAATLRRCIAESKDDASAATAALKLAVLCFDTGQGAEAVGVLDTAVRDHPALAGRAAMVCALFGQNEPAGRHFTTAGGTTVPTLFLHGDAALQSGDTGMAAALFDRAIAIAGPGDRRYALERRVTTARRAGTLNRLVDTWLADEHLPTDCRLPLAAAMRESGRLTELLAWWRSTRNGDLTAAAAERLTAEVLGAARASGRTQDVLEVCRTELDRTPNDASWLAATLHALVDLGRADEADRLLSNRIAAAAGRADRLRSIGRLARSLGRDNLARDAAERLIGLGGEPAITGELMAAEIETAAGDADAAASRLAAVAKVAISHPKTIGPVASALEGGGRGRQGD